MRVALLLLMMLTSSPRMLQAQPPKQTVIPKGSVWFCTARSDFAMGHCKRSKDDCEEVSKGSGPGANGSTWPECEVKKRAAVFTLRNKLDDRWFAIAQPSFEMCKQSRRTWSREDYDNISECVAVGEKR